jgi:hypothetical protein
LIGELKACALTTQSHPRAKKKAAWFPGRPFLSYGGSTL